MRLDHCRSCGAPIVWCETASGKKMPVDADPVRAAAAERGLFELDEERDGPPLARYVTQVAAGDQLYRSHFATCDQAGDWRRSQPNV